VCRALVRGKPAAPPNMIETDHVPVRAGAAALTPEHHDVRPAWLPLVGWAGFSLLVLYAILLGGGWIGIYSVQVRVLSLGIVAVGLLGWLLVAVRRPEWRPTTAIWPTFVLPLLSFVLSTAFSPLPRLGLDYLAWAVLLTALYLLLVRILALPYARARIGGLAAMLALVLGTAYVVMAMVLWIEWWGLVGELRFPPLRPMYLSMPWGGPSAVLTVQVLLTTAAVAGLGFSTRGARTVVTLLVILTALVALVSGSRSGWLALAGVLVIMAGMWLLSPSRRASIVAVLRDRRARLGLLILGAGVIAATVILGPVILGRFLEGGDGGRPTYWATALRMLADSPVLGVGPGNWAARRIAYTETGELDFTVSHAHNQVLESGAEFGLLGLAVGALVLACVAWLVIGALRGPDASRRRWAWATVFGILYLAIATVVDSYTYPATLLPLGIAIAYLDATSDRAIWLPRRLGILGAPLRRLALVALVIGCAGAVVFLARAESSALAHARAVAAVNEADWDAGLASARDATEAEPDLPPYQVTLGLAAAGSGDWEVAEAAFLTAAAIDDLPASWLGAALAQAELGRTDRQVEASLQNAMRLGIHQPAVMFAVGQVFDRIGLDDRADDAFARAVAALPSLAADTAWSVDLDPPGRFQSILERATELSPWAGWEIALMAGDLDRAKTLASGRGDAGYLDHIIAAWSGDRVAVDAIRSEADGDPMDARALSWAARLSDRMGEPVTADRYRRLVDIGLRGASQGYEVRVGRRAIRDAALGTLTYYYGNYMYRRTTPPDLLVPGLPGLVIGDAADATGD
jgi:O-antigen ligase/tetratricopeptide (TPR) repeat protein